MKKTNTRPKESLCWNCANARSNRCAWIANKEKIWTRGGKEERIDNYKARKKKCISVYIVHECRYFKPEGKREKVIAL